MDLLANSFCCFSVWRVMIKMYHYKKRQLEKIALICRERRRALAAQSPKSFLWSVLALGDLPFLSFFSSSSPPAPSRVKMMPVWEFTPTAVTSIRPEPSMTWVPEKRQERLQRATIKVKTYARLLWQYWERFVTLENSVLRGILPHNKNKPCFVHYSQPGISASAQTSGCTSIANTSDSLFKRNIIANQVYLLQENSFSKTSQIHKLGLPPPKKTTQKINSIQA